MAIDYTNPSYSQLRKLLGFDGGLSLQQSTPALQEEVRRNQRFTAGDYFHDGAAFPGLVEDTTGKTKAVVQAEFATNPALGSIQRRHLRGVVGREPSWTHTPARLLKAGELPSDEELDLVAEVDGPLTHYWDSRRLHLNCMDAVSALNIAGEVAVRIFVRPGEIDEAGEVRKRPSLVEALELLHIEILEYGAVRRYLDREKMREIIGFEYVDEAADDENGVRTVTHFVVTFLNDDDEAVVKSWTDGVLDAAEDTTDLAGELPIMLIRANSPLLTRPLRELQDQLSKTITMMGHNSNLAGFVRLIMTGLLPPGEWFEVTDEETGRSRFAFRPHEKVETGPGIDEFLRADMIYDSKAEGWIFASNSSVNRIEPVDPMYLIKAAEYLYQNMLRAADQEHVLITGDASASAVSRVESRSQFVWSLYETKVLLEYLLRWKLRVLVMLAAKYTENFPVERYKKELRPRVDVHASGGPLSPDEKRAVIEQFRSGLMSRDTALVYLGIEDLDAEISLLERDEAHQMELKKRKAELFEIWARVLPTSVAARLAGLGDEETSLVEGSHV